MTDLVETIVASLSEVHDAYAPPDVDQRTAAWWWGAHDDEIAWALCMCHTAARDRMAQTLYIAHVAEDLSAAREIKDWAYAAALDVAARKHRHRRAVESYRPSWGHFAARDGAALALWPHLAEYVPGYTQRAREFGCKHEAYLMIREGVLRRIRDVISAFRFDLDCASKSVFSRDFIERHRLGALARGEECGAEFRTDV